MSTGPQVSCQFQWVVSMSPCGNNISKEEHPWMWLASKANLTSTHIFYIVLAFSLQTL